MALTLAIVGDRHYTDFAHFSRLVKEELERFPAEELVTGDATGVDTMALQYADEHDLPITVFCASHNTYRRLKAEGYRAVLVSDWATDGNGAGHMRNTVVLSVANRVLLFNGGGPGSANVKKQAQHFHLDVEEYEITYPPEAGTRIATTAYGF